MEQRQGELMATSLIERKKIQDLGKILSSGQHTLQIPMPKGECGGHSFACQTILSSVCWISRMALHHTHI